MAPSSFSILCARSASVEPPEFDFAELVSESESESGKKSRSASGRIFAPCTYDLIPETIIALQLAQ